MDLKLSQWLIDHYGKERYTPGLSRIQSALHDLLGGFAKTKVITIAGTNGKGETTLRLSKLLGSISHCVWISPHVLSLTERFRSQNGEIGEEDLEDLIYSTHEIVKKNNHQLTYYEFLFFAFCRWCLEQTPEYLLLEVGLGGKLDAVNVFDAQMVLLPSISRDHQEYLGNRYDLILKEKLGVLRPGAILLSYFSLQYLLEISQKECAATKAVLIDLKQFIDVPAYEFSLRNQLLACAAYSLIENDFDSRWLSEALDKFEPQLQTLAHRGERIINRGEWILFGSHNTDGVRKLIQFLSRGNYTFSRPPYDAVMVAFSQRSARDIELMLRMLKQAGLGPIKVCFFDHPKAADKEMIVGLTRQEGIEFVEDIDTFVQGTNTGRILVAGSYYFLGHLKSRLEC